MAKRDPNKTAKNKMIAKMTEELEKLLPCVLDETGITSQGSLHGKYGGKFVDYMNTRIDVIRSPEEFITIYLKGLVEEANTSASARRNLDLLTQSSSLKEYLQIFLARVYYRQSDALGRIRPDNDEQAVIWFGQEKQNYGIFITPRFNQDKAQWENDGSEIKYFPKLYWTIGHILYTGLMIPNREERLSFGSAEEYLAFFLNVLVRASGSEYEYKLAELYRNYVLRSDNKEDVPLLIPEYRYAGIASKHKYRLDFTLINPYTLQRFGFELSPWSTHGKLSRTKKMTQSQINECAKSNFEKEMTKHKEFFRAHNVFTRIYTDEDLKDIENIFACDMIPILESRNTFTPTDFGIIDKLLS